MNDNTQAKLSREELLAKIKSNDAATGVAASGGRVRLPKLNVLRFSGETVGTDSEGNAINKEKNMRLVDLVNKEKDKPATEESLGEFVDGVIIANRRKLVEGADKDSSAQGDYRNIWESAEHASPYSPRITIFGKNGDIEHGENKELRERFKGLGVVQVLYVYLPERDETVRFEVKGLSFKDVEGDNPKDGLFTYFNKNKNVSTQITRLEIVKQKSDSNGKFFYAIGFKNMGDIEDVETLQKVLDVQTGFVEIFDAYDNQFVSNETTNTVDEAEDTKAENPVNSDDTDVEDIPF